MEIQDAKQARPHNELIAELLDSRQPKTEREHAAVREIKRLRAESAENERLRTQVAALQARLDALMLEFCPDEMSEEQIENWARYQRPARMKCFVGRFGFCAADAASA